MSNNNYGFTEEELSIFKGLSSPDKIQQFLDEASYSSDHFTVRRKSVIRDRRPIV